MHVGHFGWDIWVFTMFKVKLSDWNAAAEGLHGWLDHNSANSRPCLRRAFSLDELVNWCRMSFNPKKSRSLSIEGRRGKKSRPNVRPFVDSQESCSTGKLQKTGLATDKCKFKIWCRHYMLILKLRWPLLIYDIRTSEVEALEKKINVAN